METVRQALEVYERYAAGNRTGQALGRAITDELARSVRELLAELRLADLERRAES
jgi:hypothetical protein